MMRARTMCAMLALLAMSALPGAAPAREAGGKSAPATAGAIRPDAPPFSLTLAQLFQWSPASPLADARNRSRVPLADRFTVPDAKGDPQVRVMISPDGMNDFGNYLERQPKFNLYNFTHWSQIDILNWFGGTADRPVNIPARPWVEAAHRNGVKIFGTLFFGPQSWGGSPANVEALLRQAPDGHFPAAAQLVAMARYYGFDGWLINEETGLDERNIDGRFARDPALTPKASDTARRMMAFMAELKGLAMDSLEIHWVEAMLPDGSVGWQSALNTRNAMMLQDGGTRRADGVFINYEWTPAGLRSSAALAERLGRSRYDLFIGADLWPMRDNVQAAFSNDHWLRDMTDPATGKAYGSIALFAPNFGFNFPGNARTPRFSNFDTDPTDFARFYQAERRLFAGDEGNLAAPAPRGWPGLGALVPPKGVVIGSAFRTHFNLGHGTSLFRKGRRVGGAWHDMAEQDLLPTWQFAFTPGTGMDAGYDFSIAYEGGSSLRVTPPRPSGPSRPSRPGGTLSLYALRLPPHAKLGISLTALAPASGYDLRLSAAGQQDRALPIAPARRWRTQQWCVEGGAGDVEIALSVAAGTAGPLHLGALSLTPGCKGGTRAAP